MLSDTVPASAHLGVPWQGRQMLSGQQSRHQSISAGRWSPPNKRHLVEDNLSTSGRRKAQRGARRFFRSSASSPCLCGCGGSDGHDPLVIIPFNQRVAFPANWIVHEENEPTDVSDSDSNEDDNDDGNASCSSTAENASVSDEIRQTVQEQMMETGVGFWEISATTTEKNISNLVDQKLGVPAIDKETGNIKCPTIDSVLSSVQWALRCEQFLRPPTGRNACPILSSATHFLEIRVIALEEAGDEKWFSVDCDTDLVKYFGTPGEILVKVFKRDLPVSSSSSSSD